MRSGLEEVGSLDGLVNCAAWSFHKPLSETTISEFDRVVAINQRAPFFLSQAFAEAVPGDNPDPCIVKIPSVIASIGTPNFIPYPPPNRALFPSVQPTPAD